MEHNQQSQIERLRQLVLALQEQIRQRRQEQGSLYSTIDCLRMQKQSISSQLQSLKQRTTPSSSNSPNILTVPQPQSQFKYLLDQIEHFKQVNQRLMADIAERQAKVQMEKMLLHRQMDVLKKLAVQNDNTTKRMELHEGIIRGKDEVIQRLQEEVRNREDEAEELRVALEGMRHKVEALEQEKGNMEYLQGQLGKYQKELPQSKKAYDELKNQTSIRIDMLEHKLNLLNNEIQKHLEEKSQNLIEREQMGRSISELRQVNQMLTLQVQTLSKEYEDLVQSQDVSHNGNSNIKQDKQIESLRTELSRLIAINFTLSKELNSSRELLKQYAKDPIKSGRRSEIDSQRYKASDTFRDRDQSPVYDRSARQVGDEQQINRNIRNRQNPDERVERELRRLRHDLLNLKTQNSRITKQNIELAEMNQFLVKKNTNLQMRDSAMKPQSPLYDPYDDDFIPDRIPDRFPERFPQRIPDRLSERFPLPQSRTAKNSSYRPQDRLADLAIDNEQARSSRQLSNKAKLLALQRKINEIKFQQRPRLSPRNRNVL